MGLTQLVYVSRRTEALPLDVLSKIVAHSAAANQARGVTGVLLVCGQNVLQLLEGEGDVVDALFAHIARDPRHADVRSVLRKDVSRRLCPEWGMTLAAPESRAVLDRTRLLRVLDGIALPAGMSKSSVEARVLINDFREQLGQAA